MQSNNNDNVFLMIHINRSVKKQKQSQHDDDVEEYVEDVEVAEETKKEKAKANHFGRKPKQAKGGLFRRENVE
jgi:hypothetical protein